MMYTDNIPHTEKFQARMKKAIYRVLHEYGEKDSEAIENLVIVKCMSKDDIILQAQMYGLSDYPRAALYIMVEDACSFPSRRRKYEADVLALSEELIRDASYNSSQLDTWRSYLSKNVEAIMVKADDEQLKSQLLDTVHNYLNDAIPIKDTYLEEMDCTIQHFDDFRRFKWAWSNTSIMLRMVANPEKIRTDKYYVEMKELLDKYMKIFG